MSHVRQQLRESVASLVTGLVTTGSRVFQSRIRPQRDSQLPCLLVMSNEEEIIEANGIGGLQERLLQIVIVGLAMGGAGMDDTLDQIALEVETALQPDKRGQLARIDVDFDDSLEKPVGSIALAYTFRHYTHAGQPGTFA